MAWPQLILLNGCSSAGKSTLAKQLQERITEVPYLVFGFDDLIFMSPKRFWFDAATPMQHDDNPYLDEGVRMVHREHEGEPIKIKAVFGDTFKRLIKTMPAVVNTLLSQGNYVIFDHVFHDASMVTDYKKCLNEFKQLRIGVHCPLEELERREKARGDRVLGRARGLYDSVHQHIDYDLEVNTANHTTNEIVDTIMKRVKLRR